MSSYGKITWETPDIQNLRGNEVTRAQVATEVLEAIFGSSGYYKKYSAVYASETDANSGQSEKFRIFAIDMDGGKVENGFFSNDSGYIDNADTCPVILAVRVSTFPNAKPTFRLPSNSPQYDYYIYYLTQDNNAGNRPSIQSLGLTDHHAKDLEKITELLGGQTP